MVTVVTNNAKSHGKKINFGLASFKLAIVIIPRNIYKG